MKPLDMVAPWVKVRRIVQFFELHCTPDGFREWRESKHWTQDECAEVLGVSPATIKRFESKPGEIQRRHLLAMLGVEYGETCMEQALG